MQSGKSFFNQTIFAKTVRRFWPLWLVYIGTWFIAMPVALLGQLRWQTEPQLVDYIQAILELGSRGGIIISFIFAALTAMAVFSHLYSSKSTGMICVLPVRRSGVFLSCFFAGLIPLLLSNVVIMLMTLGVTALYGVADFPTLCQWLALVCMANIAFYGFASFCAMLTGQLLILPAVYGILSFTAIGLETLIRYILSCFVYGNPGNYGLVSQWLSPPVYLFNHCQVQRIEEYRGVLEGYVTVDWKFVGWESFVAYCIVGLIFVVLALLLHKHRRMETAGDTVAIQILRPVFRICLALACALILGALMYSLLRSGSNAGGTLPNMLLLLLFMLVGGVIGWFAANMLMKKTFRVFRCNLRGLGVFLIVLCALSFACEFDLFGYEKRVPLPEDVQSVSLRCTYLEDNQAEFSEPENIAAATLLHQDLITNKQQYEQEHPGISKARLMLDYTLADGKTLSRSYQICITEDIPPLHQDIISLEQLLNTHEGILSRKALLLEVIPENIARGQIFYDYVYHDDTNPERYMEIRLTPEAVCELYTECILPDLEDGTIGLVYLSDRALYEQEVYNLNINFELNKLDPLSEGHRYMLWDDFYTHPTIHSTRTVAWLNEHGVRLELVGDALAEIEAYEQAEQLRRANGEIVASATDLGIEAERVIDVS